SQYTHARSVKLAIDTMAELIKTKEVLFRVERRMGREIAIATRLGKRFLQCLKTDFTEIDKRYKRHALSRLYTLFRWYVRCLALGAYRMMASVVVVYIAPVQRIRAFADGEALPARPDNLRRSERKNWSQARDRLARHRRTYSRVLAI